MISVKSEENKSSSGTSESERLNFNFKLRSYKYPIMPKRNYDLRHSQNSQEKSISTNLFEIKFIDEYHKFTLFSSEILPEIALDNFSLRRQIYTNITLPSSFKKFFWAGNNLYAFIAQDEGKNDNYNNIEIAEEINNIKYNIKLKKIKEIIFKNINDFNGTNQQIKSIIENLFRSILMRNPNVIKFHDRTIFEIDPKNIKSLNQNDNKIYKGYVTSAHITENGLYMKINNRNKLISGKTAYEKMKEIRDKLKLSSKELNDKLNEYFSEHKTVLTAYGSLKSYRIKEVNFSRTPQNTDITIKDNNGVKKTVSIINYYKIQYGINIEQKNQPLLVAENTNTKNKKLSSNNKEVAPKEDDYVIYLIPELVYLTGMEDDIQNNRRNLGRNIISKTKMDPAQKMSTINEIHNLINSNNHKKIKKRNGQELILKSPKEIIDEWGINIGNNLSFKGRTIPQPHLFFKNPDKKYTLPKNGIFRSEKPYNSKVISNTNIFFIYDKNEHSNHRYLFIEIMKKFRSKEFTFSPDFNPNNVAGYGLENTNNWESINNSLRRINKPAEDSFGIIFCSGKLEKFYDKLKNFFFKEYNIPTQFVLTRNLENQKRTNSIQFNLIDQINVKKGGINFNIDFIKEGVIKSGQVFLIIGLDSKSEKKKLIYSMTSTNNPNLNNFITQEEICNSANQDKNRTLRKMFEVAIDEINKKCPHSPDYIIIYRQGGNEFYNKKCVISEIDSFKDILKEYREKYKDNRNFHFRNTKLYYICCNLKSDLKFFETEEHGISKAYFNPKSGLVIDDNVTQSDKFEYYIQPQFVNEGTATPCHYQVMYYDKSQNEENELKIEELEKLSFYLSFYYWTWAGAIRMPSLLKMSTTAMTFYTKIFNDKQSYIFRNPTYI